MKRKSPVRLLSSDAVTSPLVHGLFRPCLVLPRRSLGSLCAAELRHVFLHELGHVKRGDLAVAWLAAGLQALHWFNPVIWYGLHRMRQDRELACDALAVSMMGPSEADTYGDTLIGLMDRRVSSMRTLVSESSAVGMIETRSSLERRIEMIARHSALPYRVGWVGIAMLVLCAAALLTRARVEASASVGPKADTAFTYSIPIEAYTQSWSKLKAGDSVEITELRGTSARIEPGQTYQVKGRYELGSRDRAALSLYSTNGEVESERGKAEVVQKGKGEFVREFRVVKPGMLHLDYYPVDGGDGFGGDVFPREGHSQR